MWYRLYGNCTPAPHQVLEALPEGLVPVETAAPATDLGSGIVFFSGCDEGLPRFLQLTTQEGRITVLAVSLGEGRLPSGFCWQLLAAGAADVIEWHSHTDPARVITARMERWAQIDEVLQSKLVQENLIGKSPAWVALLRHVVEAARFSGAPVLLLGPSGTGKELLARLIHTVDSRRPKRELVILDCTTVVAELSGSEFFGHERGAFTGAVAARDGAFAMANGGTLFLDEVGELPLALQAQLLRVIQEGKYKRVGGNQWYDTSFRLICATNRDLPQEVAEGRFRADLYYRVAGTVFRTPSLAHRQEDIVPLAEYFLASALSSEGLAAFDDTVKEYLLSKTYLGNVRDLKRLVGSMCLRHAGPGPITLGDIPENERPASAAAAAEWRDGDFEMSIRRALLAGAGLKEIGKVASETAIRVALEEAAGNVTAAARRLRVTDRALQMRRAAGRQESTRPGPAASGQSA